jgi:Uma2 family endonuclease
MVLLKTRRFTLGEYRRMGDAGILSVDDRVELIEGEIVEMTPIGPPHAGIVDRIARALTLGLGLRGIVRVQGPVQLPALVSELNPDVALLRPREDFYTRSHPAPADVLLLIEVMDTSAERDRRVKLPLYARAGISEVWLVDLGAACIEVYRDLAAGDYREASVRRRGEALVVPAFPDVRPTVEDLLG